MQSPVAKEMCMYAFVFLPVRILSRHRVYARQANWKCWKANCQLLCRFHPGLTTAPNWKYRSSSRTVCAAKQDYKIHFKRYIHTYIYRSRMLYTEAQNLPRGGRYALTCQKFHQSFENQTSNTSSHIFVAKNCPIILKRNYQNGRIFFYKLFVHERTFLQFSRNRFSLACKIIYHCGSYTFLVFDRCMIYWKCTERRGN